MQPKPDFWGAEFAARFQNQNVVDRYSLRAKYPPETFRILANLITDEPRVLLDAGCGTGDVARHMLDYVERIDAVDISIPMMEHGKALPGGDSPKLRWLYGAIEDIPLAPPYALVTTGQSLHWMDWDVVLPRFARLVTPHGMLAVLDAEVVPGAWSDDLLKIIRRYTTSPRYQEFDLIEELEKRHLFQKIGEVCTLSVPFVQSAENQIEAFHSQSSLSRDHMTPENAAAFDAEARELLNSHAQDGNITLQVFGQITWGKPLGAKS
ncbi:MAG TPA: class I SAM-dependent methyltransferase [Ktedonobacteraceae bacterium]